MNKLNSKRNVIILVSILLLSLLLFIYFNIYGNPISKSINKKKFANYIQETYPNQDFKITDITYSCKLGNYDATVTSENLGITFSLSSSKDGSILDQYKHGDIIDYEQSRHFSDTIEQYLYEDLRSASKSDVYNMRFVTSVNTAIPQGKYKDKKTQYSPSMDDAISININIYSDDLTTYKDDLISFVHTLNKSIEARNYQGKIHTNFLIYYGDSSSPSYKLSVSKDELKMDTTDLEKLIEKM